jgi:hypothetical protein
MQAGAFHPEDKARAEIDAMLVILLAGGTKKRQSEDIAAAKARWVEYKERKTSSR